MSEASSAASSISSPGSVAGSVNGEGDGAFPRPLVVLLLHGDHDIFEQRFMTQGSEGGRLASDGLRAATVAHLAKRGFGDESSYRLQAYYFYNKQHLVRTGVVREFAMLDQFMRGFNSGEWSCVAVDAGASKCAAQNKVVQYLTHHCEPYSGDVVLLGGLPSGRLALALHQLHPAARSLVTLVRTTRLKAPEFDDLAHVQTTRDLQPLFDQRVRAAGGGFAKGGAVQRQTPQAGSLADLSALQHALHACNDHYLREGGCTRGAGLCPYSHDFAFTEAEWAELPLRARRTPCKAAKHGGQCPDGEKCIWGHKCGYRTAECPHGRSCWFLKVGLKHVDEQQ